jgi:hypothetical protein
MRPARLILPVLTVAAAVLFAPVPDSAPTATAAPPTDRDWREVFNPDGSITQKLVPKAPKVEVQFKSAVFADVIPVQETGSPDARFDLVFVGDGYSSSDLDAYTRDVKSKWDELSAVEPFASYKKYFNVWQVNVVSTESGVDNDPTLGINRVTAMDMGFWCQGLDQNTERLLCVNESKARQYAALAPQADQIIALGHTTKYGGAGGSVATAAGGNASAGQIAVHELGHSIGGLADEYDYPYNQYTGEEPGEPNVTKDATGAKWSGYLGQESPDGGTVGAYQGGKYYKLGLYRPTSNSIMRTLGKQFNLIGRDTMIKAFKKKIPELSEVQPAGR